MYQVGVHNDMKPNEQTNDTADDSNSWLKMEFDHSTNIYEYRLSIDMMHL